MAITVPQIGAPGGPTGWAAALNAALQALDVRTSNLEDESVPKTLVDAKGDLLVGTSGDTVGRLPVGGTGRQLFADPAQTAGMRWGGAGELPTARDLSPTDDLNTVMVAGFYYLVGTPPNSPIATEGYLTVRRRADARWIHQEVFGPNPARIFVRRSVDGGETWNEWTEVRTGAPLAGNTITGSGTPEGAVSAPVGTRYVDTAATNGAVEWVKSSGAGSIGWRVVFGDTGWRNVTADLINGWSADFSVRIRRTVAGCYLFIEGLRPAASTDPAFIVLPEGFRPTVTDRFLAHTLDVAPVIRRGSVTAAGSAAVVRSTGDASYNATHHWLCPLPWPATLPGTSA